MEHVVDQTRTPDNIVDFIEELGERLLDFGAKTSITKFLATHFGMELSILCKLRLHHMSRLHGQMVGKCSQASLV